MTGETQDEPALAQNATTDEERLDGLIAQLHADLAGHDAALVEKALRSRLSDAGITLDEGAFADVVARIAAR